MFVRTPETPPTSFCRRDWMTPVLVRVKKPSSIACRCSKSLTRRSPVTLLPTVEVNQVCTTPRPAESTNSPIMMRTSRSRRSRSGGPPSIGKSAWSKICCTMSAGTTAMAAPAITSTPVMRIWKRYGRNSATTRRPRCGMRGASALSFFWASMSTGRNPPPPPPLPPMLTSASLLTGSDGRAGEAVRVIAHRPRRASRQPRSMTRFTTVPMITAPKRYASSDCAITSRRISFVRTALSPTWYPMPMPREKYAKSV